MSSQVRFIDKQALTHCALVSEVRGQFLVGFKLMLGQLLAGLENLKHRHNLSDFHRDLHVFKVRNSRADENENIYVALFIQFLHLGVHKTFLFNIYFSLKTNIFRRTLNITYNK